MRFYTTPFKDGDERIRSFFAFLPVIIKGEMRWLERVTVRERYWAGLGAWSDWNKLEFIDQYPARP